MDSPDKSPANIASSNLYERLGISPYATPGEIEKQWRARLRELHPDAGGTSKDAALLNEAKNILSNPKLRAVYDKDGMAGVEKMVKEARARAVTKSTALAVTAAGPLSETRADVRPPAKRNLNLVLVGLLIGFLVTGSAAGGIIWWVLHTAKPQPAPMAQNSTPAPKAEKRLVIIAANWGTNSKNTSVADILRNQIKDGHLDITASNELFTDAAPNAVKRLLVTYEINGKRESRTIPENAMLTLDVNSAPVASAPPKPAANPPVAANPRPGGLIIRTARWGANPSSAASANVAPRVTEMIQDNRLGFLVSSDVLGADPNPGQPKKLLLVYQLNNSSRSITFNDGDTAIIPAGSPGEIVQTGPGVPNTGLPAPTDIGDIPIAPSGLSLVKAQWGEGKQQTDVTQKLRDLLRQDHLDFIATNGVLGDPAPGRTKQLVLTYDYQGKRTTTTYKPEDLVSIGDLKPEFAKRYAAARAQHATGIVVLEALWGGDTKRDVADICQAAVDDDSLTIAVSPQAFGEKGAWRANLKITTTTDGQNLSVQTLSDGQTLQIGKNVTSFVRLDKGLQNLKTTMAELRKTYPDGLLVLDARWGADANWQDVTDMCQKMVTGDSLTIAIGHEGFNLPAIWRASFEISYYDGKQIVHKSVGEGTLQIGDDTTSFVRMGKGMQNASKVIQELRKTYPTGLLVLDARWGADANWQDVTDICQKMVAGDSLTLAVGPEGFNMPAIWRAGFNITYFDGKQIVSKNIGEGNVQIGPDTTSFVRKSKGMQNLAQATAAFRKNHPTGLFILDARYGSGSDNVDVTDDCQALVSGDSASIPTSHAAFNQAAIWQAGLTVTYTDGKETKTVTAGEYTTLQIGPKTTAFLRPGGGAITVDKAVAQRRTKYGDGLLILNASYGDGNDVQDVSDILQARVVAGKLSTKIGGAGFPDPAFGHNKHIDITYWDGTSATTLSAKDGELINLVAALPDGLKSLVPLPAFVAAGKPVAHNFTAAGAYTLTTGPAGATLAPDGRLAWTPTEAQAGTQEFKFTIHLGGKDYIQSFSTEVVSGSTAAAVGGDLKKLQSFMRLDLTAEAHTYSPNFDRKDALVLEKDKLTVIDADGISVKKTLTLPKTYVRIAERDTYYVAIRLDPLAMDILDKQTGKVTRVIKLDYRKFEDLALLPGKPISYVSADVADTVPHDRIVVIHEDTGEVREPKDLMGTFLRIDHSGQHMWVGLKDIYRRGTEYHIDPNFNVYDVPTYGNIDYLLRYDITDGGLELKDHLQSAGGNGSSIQISPNGQRVTYLSFTGFPMYTKNISAWSGLDFEKKPVVYDTKGGSQNIDFHPVLPLVVIAKEETLLIYGRESGDEEPNRIKIAPGTLAGITIKNAQFSPDGLSVILDCQQGEKFFLYKIPLLLTDAEKATVKKGLPNAPAPKPADAPPSPGVERG